MEKVADRSSPQKVVDELESVSASLTYCAGASADHHAGSGGRCVHPRIAIMAIAGVRDSCCKGRAALRDHAGVSVIVYAEEFHAQK